jgi:hypothetical protein
VTLDLDLGAVSPYQELVDDRLLAILSAHDHGALDRLLDRVGDPPKGGVDRRQGRLSIPDGQIGQVDIDGQAGEIADEQIDRRAAFQGEGLLLENQGQDAHQEPNLPLIGVTVRHRATSER